MKETTMNEQNSEQQRIELTPEELAEIQGGASSSGYLHTLPNGIPEPFPYWNRVNPGLDNGLLLPAVKKQVGF
jgi:hypothetical protein